MKIRALMVHLLTASGLIPMMLSVDAIFKDNAMLSLIWLGVAMMIDGLDGPLARRFEVDKHWPQIDGAILDHVIDFTGYCFLPALMVYQFSLASAETVIFATSFMLMTSLYTFANRQAKTDENDFRGFPALWNIVVFHMLVFETGQNVNLAIILFLGAMTFAPTRFIHPVRVISLRPLTLSLLAVWTLMVFAYLFIGRAALPPILDIVFIFTGLYFIFLSAWRSWSLSGGE